MSVIVCGVLRFFVTHSQDIQRGVHLCLLRSQCRQAHYSGHIVSEYGCVRDNVPLLVVLLGLFVDEFLRSLDSAYPRTPLGAEGFWGWGGAPVRVSMGQSHRSENPQPENALVAEFRYLGNQPKVVDSTSPLFGDIKFDGANANGNRK